MKRPLLAPQVPPGRMIGYARVSTDDQSLDMQRDALLRAGVHPDNMHEDKVSAVAKRRPGLEMALKDAVFMEHGDFGSA